jgi:hypothetical protein
MKNTPTLNKVSLFVGLFLCAISAVFLVLLYGELQYRDYRDSKALALMIGMSAMVGIATLYISLKKTAR